MDVVVTGISLVSCLGNLCQSWQSLIAGKSGIKLQQPFSELPSFPLGLIGEQPVFVDDLIEPVVKAALADADLEIPLSDVGVVIGSSRGFQANWEELLRNQDLDKRNWLETLPHQAAIATARYIGTQGAVLAPMAACATGIWSLAQAYELIKLGQYERVIAGAVEAPITRLTLAGFEKMGALATTGCYPFDQQRQGLVLGEGAAIFVLEAKNTALRRNARIYGQIHGFGLTCDATHLNAPEASGESAIAAIKQCLQRSNLTTHEIDYIHAHGTSTKLNDQTEAKLINYFFPNGIPVSSTKGATGHTLGASGALGVAFSLIALQTQILPPCVGLNQSEFDLDLIKIARPSQIRNTLCFSFGFGGQNAVIALGNAIAFSNSQA